MAQRLLTRPESLQLVLVCVDDVEREIFEDMKRRRDDRGDLIARLDNIQHVRDRLHARIEHDDPSGSGD
jgi:hypothetical protein